MEIETLEININGYFINLEKYHNAQRYSDEQLGYSDNQAANIFIKSNPYAFLLGLVFNQSITSKMAWRAPFELANRLGHLDCFKLSTFDEEILYNFVANKPALHRFPATMAKNIISISKILVAKYNGDVGDMWKENLDINVIMSRFEELPGIGKKKSSLGVLMLARDFGIQFQGLERLPMAMDTHLNRVLTRAGHFNINNKLNQTVLQSNLRKMKSISFPALVGTSLWNLGQDYCHNENPNCNLCPLMNHCMYGN